MGEEEARVQFCPGSVHSYNSLKYCPAANSIGGVPAVTLLQRPRHPPSDTPTHTRAGDIMGAAQAARETLREGMANTPVRLFSSPARCGQQSPSTCDR